jgi:hypothetical protein
MHTLLRQPRAFASAMLLVVQVLSLGHVALAAHALSEDGKLFEVASVTVDAHHGEGVDEGHLCAREQSPHHDLGDCAIAASWSSPSVVSAPGARAEAARRALVATLTAARRFTVVQLEPLSLAPKASPPQA